MHKLLFALAFFASVSAITWKDCGVMGLIIVLTCTGASVNADDVKITNVVMTPDPAKPGQDLTMEVVGDSGS